MKAVLVTGASVLALTLCGLGPARAQAPAAPQGSAVAPPETANVLEDVVVTATRREQTLQNVPISVGVVSGEDIEESGIVQLNDLQASIPNLQVDQTNGNFAITIRGLGAGAGNLSFEQSVGLFVDGVYLSRARAFQTPLLDVARVEVVRGPQGALFGKNTNAGAISIVTRRPTRVFEAGGRAGVEVEHGGWNVEGAVSGPISQQLSGRLTARAAYSGPYIENPVKGEEEYSTDFRAVRGQLLWAPAANFEALLKLEAASVKTDGGNIMYNNIGAATCVLCNAARAAGGGAAAQTQPGFRRTSRTFYPEFDDTEAGIAQLTLDWDLADWKLTSTTAYQSLEAGSGVDTDGGALTFLNTTLSENSSSFFQEFRGQREFGAGGALIAGLTFVSTDLEINQVSEYRAATVPFPGPFNGVTDRYFLQDGWSISPFVALDFPLTEKIILSGTLRYSREEKTGNAIHTIRGVMPPTFRPYNLKETRQEELWDYSARARYELSRAASFYVSYATGTKGGGFVSNDSLLLTNILAGIATFQYEDERAKSLELGGKFRLMEGRGTLNVALFRTKFEDLQVSQFNGTGFVTGNAAEATTQGVELDTAWAVGDYFELGGNLAYLDATYDDYPGGQCLFNAPPTCRPATNNLAGTTLVRAPEWKGQFYVEADHPFLGRFRLSERLSVGYTSRSYFQPSLNPLASQPAFTRFDGRIGLRPVDGPWELAVVGRNLTNEVILTQAFPTPNFGGDSHLVLVGQPRTVTLELSLKY